MIKSDLKKRNWTFELYEDSCAPDWEEYLNSTGVPYIYALHDKDVNPTGEPKKPHYHVMMCFDGPVTYQNIKNYADRIKVANGVVQPVGSVRGMVRYFCHKDNADKYQYSEDILQCRNGFDPKDYFALTVSQIKAFKRKVIEFIQDNEIEQYSELIDILMYSDEIDMFDIASQNTFFFTQYIKSRKEVNRDKKRKSRKEED